MDDLEELFAEASKLDIPFEENIIYQTIDDIKDYIETLDYLKKSLENIITFNYTESHLRNDLDAYNKLLYNFSNRSIYIKENYKKILLKLGAKPEELHF